MIFQRLSCILKYAVIQTHYLNCATQRACAETTVVETVLRMTVLKPYITDSTVTNRPLHVTSTIAYDWFPPRIENKWLLLVVNFEQQNGLRGRQPKTKVTVSVNQKGN